MSKTVSLFFLITILFTGEKINAQRLGLLPYKTNWQELKHDSLSIIFPEGYDATAKRVASLMLKLASEDPITKEGRYKPISVILQPYTNESRGYVGVAPYVSELTLQPNENPFTSGSLPQADLLAIQASKLVQQVNAVNTGITHLIKVIFGERAFSGMYSLAISDWLRDGQVAVAETKWTPQGRGRLSQFLLPFREKNRQGEFWKYYVLRNGSFKQNVPDHNPLGYLMTNYGNQVFGEATWDTIFRLTPRMSPIYDPFSGVVKKFYGKSNRFLYQDAVTFYGDLSKSHAVPDISYPYIPISDKTRRHAFFDMVFPCIDKEGSIYTSITSFDSIATIYKIAPDGKRTKIVSQGIQYASYFDYSAGFLVWTEMRTDPRWPRRNKNVIVIYDIAKSKKKDIKSSKGYFMPALDASAKEIVALHTDPEGKFTLHILDASTGEVIHQLPNDDNLYLGFPSFDEAHLNIIASARNHIGQMCLVEQNIETGILKQITQYSYAVLGRHDQFGPWIFLTCGIGDLDQVYAINRDQGVFYQVSKGNQAHYDPSWDPVHKNLVCTQYANNGRKLVQLPGVPEEWTLIQPDDGIKNASEASGRNLLTEPMVDRSFTLKKYPPWKNAINYYGVAIAANDPSTGIELRSLNIMNTVLLSGGYQFNPNNNDGGPYFDMSLGMWYPIVDFGYKHTTRRPVLMDSLQIRTILDEVYAGLRLPFYFSPGTFQQTLQFSTQFRTGNRKTRMTNDKLLKESNVYYAKHSVLFINSRKKAYRQPLPSWGQRITSSYTHEVAGTKIKQWFASADFALPGIKASNYILITSNMLLQKTGLNSIRLGSDFVGARGFHIQDGGKNYKLGISYGFPIVYPDIGFGNIFYVPRIRLQPFYDVAYSDSIEAISQNISSVGTELLIDLNLGKFTLGLRYARLLRGYQGNPNRFEFFIPSQRF